MFDPATAGDYYRESMKHTMKYLNASVGGLTQTSKMPWLSYSLPASACKTGSKLRKVKGSVCSKCYAHKGFYVMPLVAAAQKKRLKILLSDVERWAGSMAALIKMKAEKMPEHRRYFRWHDSGDIQNDAHFDAIKWIAQMVPKVRFYLPTKEYQHEVTAYDHITNLIVRYSMHKIGQVAPKRSGKWWATVGANIGYACPASTREAYECSDCRACWDHKIAVVDYELH